MTPSPAKSDGPATHVVVGGASGIGAAVVAAERKRGADVLVWDIAGDFDVECDITDPAAVDAATASTLERLGVPTEVTVTAGVGHSGMLLDVAADEWDRVRLTGGILVESFLLEDLADAGGASGDRDDARIAHLKALV